MILVARMMLLRDSEAPSLEEHECQGPGLYHLRTAVLPFWASVSSPVKWAPPPNTTSQFSASKWEVLVRGASGQGREGEPGAAGTHSGRTGRTGSRPRGPHCSQWCCRWAGSRTGRWAGCLPA